MTDREEQPNVDLENDTPPWERQQTAARAPEPEASSPLAKEIAQDGTLADLSARQSVERRQAEDEAQRGSSKALLGQWDTLDDKGKADWIKGEKDYSKSAQAWWQGLADTIADPSAQNLREAGLKADEEPTWLQRKIKEQVAFHKQRQQNADLMEMGVKDGPQSGTARLLADTTAHGVVDGVVANMMKGIAYAGAAIESIKGYDWNAPDDRSPLQIDATPMGKVEERALYKAGKDVSDWADARFPKDPARSTEFKAQFGEGLGSMVGFMGPTAAMGLARAGLEKAGVSYLPTVIAAINSPGISAGATGALAQAGSMTDDALKAYKDGKTVDGHQVDENDILAAFVLSVPIGATEAAPIAHLFHGQKGAWIKRIFAQAYEEGGQEFVQQVAENVTARAFYDDKRQWDDNAWDGMAIGGLLGAKSQIIADTYRYATGKDQEGEPEPGAKPVKEAKVRSGGTKTDVEPTAAPAAVEKPAETEKQPETKPSEPYDVKQFYPQGEAPVTEDKTGSGQAPGAQETGAPISEPAAQAEDEGVRIAAMVRKRPDQAREAAKLIPQEAADYIRETNPELAARLGLAAAQKAEEGSAAKSTEPQQWQIDLAQALDEAVPSRATELGLGTERAIVTPDGAMETKAKPELVELDDLRLASGEMQPRDRSRTESEAGVRERAANLDPERLMPGRVSDGGAPLVAANGTIVSGNGRVMSIAEVYRDPALKAQADAYKAALGPDAEGMRRPVLIQRLGNMPRADLVKFADLSNRTAIAGMSATERAQRDAKAAGSELMGLYQGGSFTAPQNAPFYRAFNNQVVSAAERGTVSRNGVLTKEGEDRMAAAVLAAAYGDSDLLARMLESTDDNIRNITGALQDAAGAFIRMKEAIRAGQSDAKFDISPQVVETARRIADLRDRNIKPTAFLAQQDAFTQVEPLVEALLRAFYTDDLARALGRERLTEFLTNYAEEAQHHREGGLIPDETAPADVIRIARDKALNAERTADRLAKSQGDLLKQPAQQPSGTSPGRRPAAGAGTTGQRREPASGRQGVGKPPAEQPAAKSEPGPAAREHERALRASFSSIVAGKSHRSTWAKQLFGDKAAAIPENVAKLKELIGESLDAKKLFIDRNGVLKRTKLARIAPRDTRTRPINETLSIPPDVRVTNAVRLRETETGKAVDPVIRNWADRIEAARGTDAFDGDMAILRDAAKKGQIDRAKALELAHLVGYRPKAKTSKDEALRSIEARNRDIANYVDAAEMGIQRDATNKPFVLGQEEWVSLDALGLPGIKAKIDTGAATSTLHATNIERIGTPERPQVRFSTTATQGKKAALSTITADIVAERDVRSSNGGMERRIVIRTIARMGGRSWPIEVTLTDRGKMAYRMLIGRQAILDGMLVNPGASFVQGGTDDRAPPLPTPALASFSTAAEADQAPRTSDDGFLLQLPFAEKWGDPRFDPDDRAEALGRLQELQTLPVRRATWDEIVAAKHDIEEILAQLLYYEPDSSLDYIRANNEEVSRYAYLRALGDRITPQEQARAPLMMAKDVPSDIADIVKQARQAVDHIMDSRRRGVRDLFTYGEELEPAPSQTSTAISPVLIGETRPAGFYFLAGRKLAEVPAGLFPQGGQAVINWLRNNGVQRAEINHFQLQQKFADQKPVTREAFAQAIADRVFDFRKRTSWLNPERSNKDYALGGTRAFRGPRIPGRGVYFEHLLAFPKKLKGGETFAPGMFESPHWEDSLKGTWASWRGSVRDVPDWGKMVIGEEGQTDYMQGAVGRDANRAARHTDFLQGAARVARRPRLSAAEYLELKKKHAATPLLFTPESPLDETYIRTMVRDLLILATKQGADSVAISTSATNDRIQINTKASAAHFYDDQLKPRLERELRRMTGDAALALKEVALPKAMGGAKNERPYTVWAAKLPDTVKASVLSQGMPLFSFASQQPTAAGEALARGPQPATLSDDDLVSLLKETIVDGVRPGSDGAERVAGFLRALFGKGRKTAEGRSQEGTAAAGGETTARSKLPVEGRLRSRAIDRLLTDTFNQQAIDARATAQGFTVTGYHGTVNSKGKTFDVPDPFKSDFGFHVGLGSADAANDRLGFVRPPKNLAEKLIDSLMRAIGLGVETFNNMAARNASVMPVRLRARKVLRMPDIGGWYDPSSWDMGMAPGRTTPDGDIASAEYDGPAELRGFVQQWMHDHPGDGGAHTFSHAMAAELTRLGYDAVIYKNLTENPGQDSMFVWDPRNVRSAYDVFDDRAKEAPGLTASVHYVEADLRKELNRLVEAEGLSDHPLFAFSAYHGSPRDFDRFDASQIGSVNGPGQGYAQPLGIYLASDKATGSHFALKSGGVLYQATVHAEPDEFLDWDAPLNRQSPQMQDAVTEAFGPHLDALADQPRKPGLERHTFTLEDTPRRLMFALRNRTAVTGALADAGVVGFKYQGGEPGQNAKALNYVVLPAHIDAIEITHKNGSPVSAAERATAMGVGSATHEDVVNRPYTQPFRQALPEWAPRLESELRKMLPEDVAVRMADRLFLSGIPADAITHPPEIEGEKRLISVALYQGFDQAIEKGAHEVTHVLRERGLWSDAEWSLLTERAKKIGMEGKLAEDTTAKDGELRGKLDLYREHYRNALEERGLTGEALEKRINELVDQELVASMVEDYVGGKASFGTTIDGLLARIAKFFEAMRNALHGLGFRTADDVLETAFGDSARKPVDGGERIEPTFGMAPEMASFSSWMGEKIKNKFMGLETGLREEAAKRPSASGEGIAEASAAGAGIRVENGVLVDPGKPAGRFISPTDAQRAAFTREMGWAGVNFEPDLAIKPKRRPGQALGQIAILDPSAVRIVRKGDALSPGEFRAYHGTNTAFDKIDPSKFQARESSGDLTGSGFYAFHTRKDAEGHAEGVTRASGGKPTVVEIAVDRSRVPIVDFDSFDNALQRWLQAKTAIGAEGLPTGEAGGAVSRPKSNSTPTLDLSPEARKARAEAMGFDTGKVWYHGTAGEFDAFDLSLGGRVHGNKKMGQLGISFASTRELPAEAARYAADRARERSGKAARPRVVEAWIQPGRQAVITLDDLHGSGILADDLVRLKSEGYDSVLIKNSGEYNDGADELMVFDPARIRSVNATFDPAQESSPLLMAAFKSSTPQGPTYDPRAPGLGRSPKPITSIIADLKEALGMVTTQGLVGLTVRNRETGYSRRLSPQGNVAGQYQTPAGVARIRASTDIDAIAHEGGHHLENVIGQPLQDLIAQNAAELSPLAGNVASVQNQSDPGWLSEGFAEFFRDYILKPDQAAVSAPGFYQAFEDLLDAERPGLLEDLDKLQLNSLSKDYQDYIKATAVERGMADVASWQDPSAWEQVKEFYRSSNKWDTLSQWLSRGSYELIDKTNPILKSQQALMRLADANGVRTADGRPMSLQPGENAHRIARLLARADKIGHQWILNGVPDYDGLEGIGPSLHDAIKLAVGGTSRSQWTTGDDGTLTKFGLYLEARRAVKEWERFEKGELERSPTRKSAEEYTQIIQDLEKANPTYAQAAGMVYDFQHRLLTLEYQAGKWTTEQYTALTARKDFYVPFLRDLSDIAPVTSGPGGQMAQRFTDQKAFKGSDRNIVNPLEAIAKRAYQTAAAVQFNDMVKALTTLSERVGLGGAGFIERVQRDEVLANNERTFERLKEIAVRNGMDAADAHLLVSQMEMNFQDADVHLLWDPDNLGPARPPIVPLWENGERKLVRLNDPVMGRRLFEAMNALGREQSNIWIKLIGYPAGVLRAGVTMHPAFVLSNILGDMTAAWTLTGSITRPSSYPLVTQARGLYHLLGTNPTLRGMASALPDPVKTALAKIGITSTDISELYSRVGGISGGQNVAALKAVHRDFKIEELRAKGYHVANLPAFGGLVTTVAGATAGGMIGGVVGATAGASVGAMVARMVFGHGAEAFFAQASELSETITRLGVASYAMKRAKRLDRTLSDIDAVREAAYTASDVLDFDRNGAKAGTVMKLIPFFNANIQGVSKAYRQSLVLDGERGKDNMLKTGMFLRYAMMGKDARRQKFSARDSQAIADGMRAWVNMMILAGVGAALFLAFKDDPDYPQVADEQAKATHFIFKLNGTWVRIKKPFELATLSNITQTVLEWAIGKDPRMWEHIKDGLVQTHSPPYLPQTIRLWGDLKSGIDTSRNSGLLDTSKNRPIVPDYLKRLPPYMQFSAYSSEFAIQWSKALHQIGVEVSPMKIDYALNNSIAYWGREVQVSSNYFLGKNRESPKWTDVPIAGTMINRVTLDPARKSAAVDEFWQQMGQGKGNFDAARAGYDDVLKSGNGAAAQAYLAGLTEPERLYAVLDKHFKAKEKEAHPLNRARAILSIDNALRREMILDTLVDSSVKPDPQKIPLAAAKKTEAHDILGRLSALETWNALHNMGMPGWDQRDARNPGIVLDELKASSPQVYEEMMRRRGKAHIGDYSEDLGKWGDVKQRVVEMINDDDMLGQSWTKSVKKRKSPVPQMTMPEGGMKTPNFRIPGAMMRLGGPDIGAAGEDGARMKLFEDPKFNEWYDQQRSQDPESNFNDYQAGRSNEGMNDPFMHYFDTLAGRQWFQREKKGLDPETLRHIENYMEKHKRLHGVQPQPGS